MDKTIYTKTCDADGKNGRRCCAENSNTINLDLTLLRAEGEENECFKMEFDLCPLHSSMMLEQALKIIYAFSPYEFDKIIKDRFKNVANQPLWRKVEGEQL